MIKEVKGDLLDSDANIIAHQTNCKGVMEAGVALSIKEKLFGIAQFMMYQRDCLRYGNQLLGKVQYIPTGYNRWVANMFGQEDHHGSGPHTDYKALESALKIVEADARAGGHTVAIPGYIGCGLTGGDWTHVLNDIIYPIFEKSPVKLTIVYFDK